MTPLIPRHIAQWFALASVAYASCAQFATVARIDYEHLSNLERMSSGSLAALVERDLASKRGRRAFTALRPPANKYNWQHESNGALWEAIFNRNRVEKPEYVIQAFGRIVLAIARIPYSDAVADGKGWPASTLVSIDLAASRCREYERVAFRPNSKRKRVLRLLSKLMSFLGKTLKHRWPASRTDYARTLSTVGTLVVNIERVQASTWRGQR